MEGMIYIIQFDNGLSGDEYQSGELGCYFTSFISAVNHLESLGYKQCIGFDDAEQYFEYPDKENLPFSDGVNAVILEFEKYED